MAVNDLYSIKNYAGNTTVGRLSRSRRNLVNWILSNEGNGFQKILAGFQTTNSNNIRSGFKTSDQVQGQGAGRSTKRSIHGYVSIYRRPVLHPNLKKSDANPACGATQPLGLRWDFETTSNKTRGLTIADYRARPVISKSRCRPQLKPATAELKNTATIRFSEHRTPSAIKKEPLNNHSFSGQDLKNVEFVEIPDNTADQQQAILTNRQIIAKNVQKAAAKYNLPPELIKGVIRAESNFKVKAISLAGAQGLMQLMPATAKELGVKNPFDIEQNIDGGAKYLRKMLDRFGGNVRK
ncbi:MAG: transglycosylase SLT domain-containing protein, partial [Desulfobacterales bacterium]